MPAFPRRRHLFARTLHSLLSCGAAGVELQLRHTLHSMTVDLAMINAIQESERARIVKIT
jgi:hypothetical protein